MDVYNTTCTLPATSTISLDVKLDANVGRSDKAFQEAKFVVLQRVTTARIDDYDSSRFVAERVCEGAFADAGSIPSFPAFETDSGTLCTFWYDTAKFLD